jgi:hypothetical protein
MRARSPLLASMLLGLAACTSPFGHGPAPQSYDIDRDDRPPGWAGGQPAMQGFFGITTVDKVQRKGGSTSTVDSEDTAYPAIGGGGQWRLGGSGVDLGFEGMFGLAGRGSVSAFTAGGGGGTVAVNVDLLTVDLYGGPFASLSFNDKWRAYVAAGPLFRYADYDQHGASIDKSGSGFGTGYYARTGIECAIEPGTMIGFGFLWSESDVGLSNDLGDLRVRSSQLAFTLTRGI